MAVEISSRNVLVSLLAEIARNYVELRGFQRRLAIAQDNIRSQENSVAVTAERGDAVRGGEALRRMTAC